MKDNFTLKNFTIVSGILILIGFVPAVYVVKNYAGLFENALQIGTFCFVLAYFLYALKCWGVGGQISAVFMVTLPLLVYFLATSKIPGSTTNVLLYLAIQFCFYAIISVIALYVCDKVRRGIGNYLFRGAIKTRRHFYPELSYSVAGGLVVIFLIINVGGLATFSDNAAAFTRSIQNADPHAQASSNSGSASSSADSPNSQPIPTLEPEIVKNIESTVGNSPPAIDIPALERQIHELINQQRRSKGLSPLSYDASLAAIARKHSADMAKNNFFSHENFQGLDPTGRGNQAGYSCHKNYGSYYTVGIAENIMQNNLYDSVTYYNGIPRYNWNTQEDIAQSTVNGWMESSGHRRNILTSTYDREGIGIAIASDDKVYITEDFC